MPSNVSSRHLGNGNNASKEQFEDDLNLSILGLGAEYPPHRHGSDSLDVLASRYYKPSTASVPLRSEDRMIVQGNLIDRIVESQKSFRSIGSQA